MIVRIESLSPYQVEVILPREFARVGIEFAAAHARNILVAATLVQTWEPGPAREDEEAETVVIRFIKRR